MMSFFALLLVVLCSYGSAAPTTEPTEKPPESYTWPPDLIEEVFGTQPSAAEATTPAIFEEYDGSGEWSGSGSGFAPIPRVPCPPRRDKDGDKWVEFEKCRICTCSYGEAVCSRCVPAAEDRDIMFYKELVSRFCYLETVPEVVDHAPDACCAERQVCRYISPDFLEYSYHEYGRRVNYMLIYNHGDYDLADLFY